MDKRPMWLLSLWDRIVRHQRPVRAIACFFLGHDISYGDWRCGESDWCARCWYNDGERNLEEGWTMPRLLNYAYRWMVDCHWRWFDKFDNWACSHVKWLPRWWEY